MVVEKVVQEGGREGSRTPDVPREDVVRHRRDAVRVAQLEAQREHQRRFARADGSVAPPGGQRAIHSFIHSARDAVRSGRVRCSAGSVPTDAHGEGAVAPVAAFDQRHLAAHVRARAVEDVVRVAVLGGGEGGGVGVRREVVVGVKGCHSGGGLGKGGSGEKEGGCGRVGSINVCSM